MAHAALTAEEPKDPGKHGTVVRDKGLLGARELHMEILEEKGVLDAGVGDVKASARYDKVVGRRGGGWLSPLDPNAYPIFSPKMDLRQILAVQKGASEGEEACGRMDACASHRENGQRLQKSESTLTK